ncbi:hypothetical protein SAMN06265349_1011067 [Flavobacterium resistens]|uniref:Uncharacterized protein n=1 Tax=Flavobacterium resistens TaxID=443612 RepID=A0A521BJ75_9FLAO|nr:hypothetical protein [Flavobacterium resistens]MRX67382.1 hypothetical protein [Flavobacterium resistens]SMO46720.1 hypothetical protein SAMN06265349_1011067 [Flavobacterium resistens]
MHKIWKLKNLKSNDKVIVIKDNIIYKGNLQENELNRINSETHDFTFLKDLFSIPYAYIKQIENQDEKNYIKIFFGRDSEEIIYIDNENIKNEVFEFIKLNNPHFKYSAETPDSISYAKAQFFALLSISVIFIWSLYLALQIESGVRYELVGGGNPGITGIVLAIANLGSIKIITGYIILLSIGIFALLRRLKSRSEIRLLKR